MPNYFIFLGPNATVGHGSLIYSLGWAADWMVKWMRKMAEEDIASVAPRQDVVDEFVRYGDEIMKKFTWTSSCACYSSYLAFHNLLTINPGRSWYKNNREDGRVTATFAGSALLFKRLIEDLRPEDFELRYRSRNRFRFMGNGFTEYELRPDVDLAWYVDH